MTQKANARVAGSMFLLYIVVGLSSMFVGRGSMTGGTTAAKLASMAAHASQVRVDVMLGLLVFCIAITLAVSLYGITRGVDHELSVLALCCRVTEAVVGFVPVVVTLALLALASEPSAAGDLGTQAAAEMLMRVRRYNPTLSATFFALGSTVFSYLLLRGRLVPRWLAWLGVVASVVLVVVLPLQLVGAARGTITQVCWLPMLVFEVTVALWFIIRGVSPGDALPSSFSGAPGGALSGASEARAQARVAH